MMKTLCIVILSRIEAADGGTTWGGHRLEPGGDV